MAHPLFIVDAFADAPFSGNPAAVCLLESPGDEQWMQNVAAEMNLSETAFLVPETETGRYSLRWFTPKVEVPLCGHATLASAQVLWTTGRVARESAITFSTLSGDLVATCTNDGEIGLDFPAKKCYDYAPPMELLLALGAKAKSIQRNNLDVLIEVSSESEVRNLCPNVAELGEIPNIRGVIITARAESENQETYDFVSRFFAPAAGVNEDPVTGSAHCALGPFWATRLGKNPVVGYQASKRGGIVKVSVDGDRVILSGRATIVVEGQLFAL